MSAEASSTAYLPATDCTMKKSSPSLFHNDTPAGYSDLVGFYALR